LLGLNSGEATKAYREETAQILLNYKSQPDELWKLGVRPEDIKPYLPFLERHNYNVFAKRDTIKSGGAYDP
jgi:hypothetical protein